MTGSELPEIDLSEIGRLPNLGDNNLGALDKLPGLNKFLGISSSLMWALSVELKNEGKRAHFAALGKGKRNYTSQQKDFLLSQIDTYGVRATSRIIGLPRRTIQRWCKQYNKRVRRCPLWVYDWAERRRKRREFWERRGYY
jgi:hypothetical protein